MNAAWTDPRRAGLLMGGYFLLSLATGPVIYVRIGTGAGSLAVGWALSALLAWRVTRGGRISRTLLLVIAGAGLIAGVIFLAIRFSWADLGLLAACGAQLALLLSPAVYQRTRPADERPWPADERPRPADENVPLADERPRPGGERERLADERPWPADERPRNVALWRRRTAAPLVAVLAAGAVLGLAGAAASAGVISSRVRGYDSANVRVLPGHPVSVTLGPGRYGAFGGCADEWGCDQLAPRDVSVRGALSGAVGTVSYTRLELRSDAGQSFNRDLTFTVPVREAVRIALNVNPRQPVLVAPSQDEAGLIHHEVTAAIGCALLLLASLTALAWPVAPRPRRRAA